MEKTNPFKKEANWRKKKKKSQILELGFSMYLNNSSWVGKITQRTTTL